jgi:hypothetical protein
MSKRLEELGIHYNAGIDRYEYKDGRPLSDTLDRELKHGATVEGTRMYKIFDPVRNRYEASPTPFPISNYRQTAVDVVEEVLSARKHYGAIASAHEGYAILLEEMDEVKEHVWIKQKNRDQAKLRKELVQLAAMAVAMIVEIADADNRR